MVSVEDFDLFMNEFLADENEWNETFEEGDFETVRNFRNDDSSLFHIDRFVDDGSDEVGETWGYKNKEILIRLIDALVSNFPNVKYSIFDDVCANFEIVENNSVYTYIVWID